jgi:D-alanyl-lipoteichoic acid acyltransferase DltB (MBOAT superfamily)
MTISQIVIISIVVILFRLLLNGHGKNWVILCTNLFFLYLLQPVSPIRNLWYWLPFITLTVIVLSWIALTTRTGRNWQAILKTLSIVFLILILVSLTRYVELSINLFPVRPPRINEVLVAIGAFFIFFLLFSKVAQKVSLFIAIVLIISLFVILKQPTLSFIASKGLRALSGQNPNLAKFTDIRWIGFSYIAFRLIHTLRDKQNDRFNNIDLETFINYCLFFPTLPAGPIDRLDHFKSEISHTKEDKFDDFVIGGKRIVFGLFKKFAISDSLALIALNNTNAEQVDSTIWMWTILFAYSFFIYFDFSGYSDIAIGLSRLMGVKMPENFNKPYLMPNLAKFWNGWHITLTQWFRAYFYNPFTRYLRTRKKPLPIKIAIFITQIVTMVLVGMWHGLTWNFIVWGVWHGLGLFIQNRWSYLLTPVMKKHKENLLLNNVLNIVATTCTFIFVSVGWVWFAVTEPEISWHVLRSLVGIGE